MSNRITIYRLTICDPMGTPICGMQFASFDPDDEHCRWFQPLFFERKMDSIDETNYVRLSIDNPMNPALPFILEIEKTP